MLEKKLLEYKELNQTFEIEVNGKRQVYVPNQNLQIVLNSEFINCKAGRIGRKESGAKGNNDPDTGWYAIHSPKGSGLPKVMVGLFKRGKHGETLREQLGQAEYLAHGLVKRGDSANQQEEYRVNISCASTYLARFTAVNDGDVLSGNVGCLSFPNQINHPGILSISHEGAIKTDDLHTHIKNGERPNALERDDTYLERMIKFLDGIGAREVIYELLYHCWMTDNWDVHSKNIVIAYNINPEFNEEHKSELKSIISALNQLQQKAEPGEFSEEEINYQIKLINQFKNLRGIVTLEQIDLGAALQKQESPDLSPDSYKVKNFQKLLQRKPINHFAKFSSVDPRFFLGKETGFRRTWIRCLQNDTEKNAYEASDKILNEIIAASEDADNALVNLKILAKEMGIQGEDLKDKDLEAVQNDILHFKLGVHRQKKLEAMLKVLEARKFEALEGEDCNVQINKETRAEISTNNLMDKLIATALVVDFNQRIEPIELGKKNLPNELWSVLSREEKKELEKTLKNFSTDPKEMTLYEGAIIAILAPDNSLKTMFLKAISGLLNEQPLLREYHKNLHLLLLPEGHDVRLHDTIQVNNDESKEQDEADFLFPSPGSDSTSDVNSEWSVPSDAKSDIPDGEPELSVGNVKLSVSVAPHDGAGVAKSNDNEMKNEYKVEQKADVAQQPSSNFFRKHSKATLSIFAILGGGGVGALLGTFTGFGAFIGSIIPVAGTLAGAVAGFTIGALIAITGVFITNCILVRSQSKENAEPVSQNAGRISIASAATFFESSTDSRSESFSSQDGNDIAPDNR